MPIEVFRRDRTKQGYRDWILVEDNRVVAIASAGYLAGEQMPDRPAQWTRPELFDTNLREINLSWHDAQFGIDPLTGWERL